MQRVHFQMRVGVFNFQDKYLFSIFDIVETGISSHLMGHLARMQTTLPYRYLWYCAKKTNRIWFSVVCILIHNDTRHHSGQNLLRTHSAAQWSKFVADSLGCASWVHNILTTLMTRIEWLWWGCIKCRQVVSIRYGSTRLDLRNSRVDRVRLSIKLLEVDVVGVQKMSSSRVE